MRVSLHMAPLVLASFGKSQRPNIMQWPIEAAPLF